MKCNINKIETKKDLTTRILKQNWTSKLEQKNQIFKLNGLHEKFGNIPKRSLDDNPKEV